MKNINRILMILLLGAAAASCDKFLERSAQDIYVPSKTEDYANILRGEAYFTNLLENYRFVAMMTDEVEFLDYNEHAGMQITAYGVDSRYEDLVNAYTWQEETETSLADASYQYLYRQSQIANIVLENVDKSKGTEEEKAILRGQASFTRAFSYLMLANLYAKPYGLAQPGDPCVPIKLESTPSTDPYPRKSFKEVYDLIISDIKVALDNLKDRTVPNMYEIRYSAALILAMRTALYMEDWDAAIRYGEEFIALGEYELMDITGKTKATNSTTQSTLNDAIVNFISYDNKEIAWCFGERSGSNQNYNTIFNFMNLSCGGFRVSGPKTPGGTNYTEDPSTLAGTFIGIFDYDFTTEKGDFRLPYWFIRPLWKKNTYVSRISNYLPIKFDYNDKQYNCNFVFRLGEVYITLAEAYARKSSPDTGKALSYLNDLRVKRIKPYTYLTSNDFASNTALVEFIWEERRRELCMEELHRWWDLRRTNRPRLEHKINNQTWVLEKDDLAYTLNFPFAERAYSGAVLGNNPRPDRPAQ